MRCSLTFSIKTCFLFVTKIHLSAPIRILRMFVRMVVRIHFMGEILSRRRSVLTKRWESGTTKSKNILHECYINSLQRIYIHQLFRKWKIKKNFDIKETFEQDCKNFGKILKKWREQGDSLPSPLLESW